MSPLTCAGTQLLGVPTGPHEGGLEEQWEQLAAAGSDLAAAPDDEVLAEMLALQGELLQQAAVNRARLRGVVASLLEDAPRQHEAALRRKSGIEFARQYHDVRSHSCPHCKDPLA